MPAAIISQHQETPMSEATKTIDFNVMNRWTGEVQFTAKIEADDSTPLGVKLGLAVKWAIKARAYLADANLAGVNLARADLAGADLAGANLAGANLAGANLVGAYLAGAYLADAYLADAYLVGANLAGVNLARANLVGADLTRANLVGADLTRANLAGARWRDGVTLSRAPLQIHGLHYAVTILDQHMQIGCELHSLAEWAAFDDRRILAMDGKEAAKFWAAHKDALLSLARSDGRSFEPVAIPQAAE